MAPPRKISRSGELVNLNNPAPAIISPSGELRGMPQRREVKPVRRGVDLHKMGHDLGGAMTPVVEPLVRSADFVGNMFDPAGLPSWREVGEGAERFAKGGVNDAAYLANTFFGTGDTRKPFPTVDSATYQTLQGLQSLKPWHANVWGSSDKGAHSPLWGTMKQKGSGYGLGAAAASPAIGRQFFRSKPGRSLSQWWHGPGGYYLRPPFDKVPPLPPSTNLLGVHPSPRLNMSRSAFGQPMIQHGARPPLRPELGTTSGPFYSTQPNLPPDTPAQVRRDKEAEKLGLESTDFRKREEDRPPPDVVDDEGLEPSQGDGPYGQGHWLPPESRIPDEPNALDVRTDGIVPEWGPKEPPLPIDPDLLGWVGPGGVHGSGGFPPRGVGNRPIDPDTGEVIPPPPPPRDINELSRMGPEQFGHHQGSAAFEFGDPGWWTGTRLHPSRTSDYSYLQPQGSHWVKKTLGTPGVGSILDTTSSVKTSKNLGKGGDVPSWLDLKDEVKGPATYPPAFDHYGFPVAGEYFNPFEGQWIQGAGKQGKNWHPNMYFDAEGNIQYSPPHIDW